MLTEVYQVVSELWHKAAHADDGLEAEEWPVEWLTGLVIHMWKRKGSKKDKNTWRGITLLSVGSKILARIVSSRTQKWSEQFLDETQCGFRGRRGVDDCLQVSRRVVEEVVAAEGGDKAILVLYDLEKAYPRLCREALWALLRRRGCDTRYIKVCMALHEGTAYCVRSLGRKSSKYGTDRGLREGCPSSPPLFNVYHHFVMTDFRERRRIAAATAGRVPGVKWRYRVDGNLVKTKRARKHNWYTGETVIGDIGFADDVGLVTTPDELVEVDTIFQTTVRDWEGKVNDGKTERVRLEPGGQPPEEDRQEQDLPKVRHLGGIQTEDGTSGADMQHRCCAAYANIRRVAKAWSLGSPGGRGENSLLPRRTRLRAVRAVTMPTVLALTRTRKWGGKELKKAQRVQRYALRRAFGLDPWIMQEQHISGEDLERAAGWEDITVVHRRQTLMWLGHVARMPVHRLPKLALFGWWDGHDARQRAPWSYATWLEQTLRHAGIPVLDWFRLAQRKEGTNG